MARATRPPDASLLLDATFRLTRATNIVGNLRLRPWDITLSSYAAMRVIADQPKLTLAQVSRRCFVRPQTMTRIVAELQHRGYVHREPHGESKRAMWLTLTDDGHAALKAMTKEVNRINADMAEVLGQAQVDETAALLRECARRVEAASELLS